MVMLLSPHSPPGPRPLALAPQVFTPAVGVKDSARAFAPVIFHVETCVSMMPLSAPTVYVVRPVYGSTRGFHGNRK